MDNPLDRLSAPRRRLIYGLLALFTAMAAVMATSLGLEKVMRARTVAIDQKVPGPVLLVPGYGGSTASLQPLAAALRADGRDVTIVTLPDGATGDLEQQAVTLAETVFKTRQRTGANSVDVVGYSAGGVVASLYATEAGAAGAVRRLVTLGSPHHGTELATLGQLVNGSCPKACQQLAPTSPLLAQLDDKPRPKNTAYVSIWTTQDDVVLPPQSAVLAGIPSPSLQSICPSAAVKHGGLPADPQVIEMVTEALASTPIPTWSTSDCTRLSRSVSS